LYGFLKYGLLNPSSYLFGIKLPFLNIMDFKIKEQS